MELIDGEERFAQKMRCRTVGIDKEIKRLRREEPRTQVRSTFFIVVFALLKSRCARRCGKSHIHEMRHAFFIVVSALLRNRYGVSRSKNRHTSGVTRPCLQNFAKCQSTRLSKTTGVFDFLNSPHARRLGDSQIR